ncbi:MAG: hypothetical protein QM622_10420 [Microbacterium sp.]
MTLADRSHLGRRRIRPHRFVTTILWGLGVALVLIAAVAAWSPSGTPTAADAERWWQPHPANGLYVLAIIALGCAGFVVHWWSRRRTFWRAAAAGIPSSILGVIVTLVGVSLVLGYSAYAPCTGDGVPVLSPLTWTILLFVGTMEPGVVGPDAAMAACQTAMPLALTIARFTAIAATFVGATTVLIAVSRDQFARVRVRFATDVDVVTGVTGLTIPLVRALVLESERRRRADGWFDKTLRERMRRRPSTRVVVIHPQREDPLAGEAIEAGAIVLIGDPADRATLERVLTHPRGMRVRLRSLHAASGDQNANLTVARVAGGILRDRLGADGTSSSRRGEVPIVPRIVVRLDDPREARDWRLTHVADGWLVDAITTDEIVAQTLVARLADAHTHAKGVPTRLVIAGDTPLTIALLDFLAWRAWRSAHLERPWHLIDVVIAGDRAEQVKREWDARRSPAARACAITVRVGADDWEAVCDRELGASAALIVTEQGADAIARAARVARLNPGSRVFARDDAVQGVGLAVDDASQAVVRYGATLLAGEGAPEDSWTQLGRLQHARWRGTDGRAASRRWGSPAQPQQARLPEFYREDNLRQHREILRAVLRSLPGCTWQPVIAAAAVREIDPGALESVARNEHERWCKLRTDQGWSGIDLDPPDDESPEQARARRLREERGRQNRNLRTWDTGEMLGAHPVRADPPWGADRRAAAVRELREANLGGIRDVLDALYHWGIAPTRDGVAYVAKLPPARGGEPQRYQRVGQAWAWRLDDARSWRTEGGDVLHAAAGDWWVITPDGSTRSVAAAEFPQLYEHIDEQVYRRIGEVTALQLRESVDITTLEGAEVGRVGDWLVTDDSGNSWAVPDTQFRRSYEPE